MRYLLAGLLVCASLDAQDAARLREALEGRRVVVKLDLPGTKDGVDVYPERATPLDFRAYQQRLKNYGTALRQGDPVMVTRVVVKDKLIEFQLGGGGYGTAGDDTNTSVTPAYIEKSKRENDLERRLQDAFGERRRDMERELDDLRRRRERENARNKAAAAEAGQIAKTRIEQRRREGGSRFNLRYESRVPASALTVDGVMAALAQWVDFPGTPAGMSTRPPEAITGAATIPLLRKGMSRREVDTLLGNPIDVFENNNAPVPMQTVVYDVSGVTARVEFANDVLVKFIYQSR